MSTYPMATHRGAIRYRFALFGSNIQESYSPLLHRYFAEQTGKSVQYILKPVTHQTFLRELALFLNASSDVGANITAPFKRLALNLPELQLTQTARAAQAVNCIYRDPTGQLWGDNGDGIAWIQTILTDPAAAPRLKTGRILILGAGGATWSLLGQMNLYRPPNATPILVGLRDLMQAEALRSWFGRHWITPVSLATMTTFLNASFDFVINATGSALSNWTNSSQFPIGNNTICYDLGYGLAARHFLACCRKKGAQHTINGLRMLAFQGALSFERWTGVLPDPQNAYRRLCQQVA